MIKSSKSNTQLEKEKSASIFFKIPNKYNPYKSGLLKFLELSVKDREDKQKQYIGWLTRNKALIELSVNALMNTRTEGQSFDVKGPVQKKEFLEYILSKKGAMQDYCKRRANQLGKKKITFHELLVNPFNNYPAKQKEYRKKFLDSISLNFGKKVSAIVLNSIKKKYGTSSSTCYFGGINDPILIEVGWNSDFESLVSFAHECGHAVSIIFLAKSKISPSSVPREYSEMCAFLMERYFVDEVVDNDDRIKAEAFMMHEDIVTIFLQATLCHFEKLLLAEYIKVGHLSFKVVSKLYVLAFKQFFGNYLVYDENLARMWVTWRQMYAPNYCYDLLVGKILSILMYKKMPTQNDFKSVFNLCPNSSEMMSIKMEALTIERLEAIFER